jgi:preprotein translocase subunit YajC
MFAHLLLLLADAAPPAGGGAPAAPSNDPFGGLGIMVPMILIFVVGYFLIMRPMRRQEAERKAMASNVKKNDKVLTAAGIYGTVVAVSDTEDEITVRVDDNTRLRMIKSSVVRNITREEEAAKPKEQTEAK